MRKTIANRLQESYHEAVHIMVTREVDAETLVAAADAGPERATVTDLVLCALSDALDEHPAFNGTFEDGTHTTYEEHNVGIAVDIDAGLVTPVVADVASKSLGEVATERRRSHHRARRAGRGRLSRVPETDHVRPEPGPSGRRRR